MGSVDPIRITVDEERHAVALAQALIGVSEVELHSERGRWVVLLNAPHTDHLVERVLDAVRQSLTGKPTASALVALNGHEYHLQGELVTTSRDRERAGVDDRLRDPERAVRRRQLCHLARRRARPLHGAKGAGRTSRRDRGRRPDNRCRSDRYDFP